MTSPQSIFICIFVNMQRHIEMIENASASNLTKETSILQIRQDAHTPGMYAL